MWTLWICQYCRMRWHSLYRLRHGLEASAGRRVLAASLRPHLSFDPSPPTVFASCKSVPSHDIPRRLAWSGRPGPLPACAPCYPRRATYRAPRSALCDTGAARLPDGPRSAAHLPSTPCPISSCSTSALCLGPYSTARCASYYVNLDKCANQSDVVW